MANGIYCYIDKKTNKVIYVGKDSYIDKNKRHKVHFYPSKYNQQPVNRILQNNPDRYEYEVLKEGNFSKNLLNALEIIYIQRYNTFRPKTNHGWNFTTGGEYNFKHKHSQKTKEKISISKSGKNHPNYGKKIPNKIREKISKTQNSTGYYRVIKKKCTTCKQGFRYAYLYYDEKKRRKNITSVSIEKLEQKVKNKGLKWLKFKD